VSGLTERSQQRKQEVAAPRLYANRVRIYPMAVHGPMRQLKWAVLAVCLTIYYLLPWLRWSRGVGRPDQAILLDVAHERFYFFGLEFWPQDIYLLTGILVLSAVGLFLVTSLFGRIWCGYSCPQTVWTDLFMWVERLIEGDRNERMKRDAAPLTLRTIWRKAAKHGAWVGIAFWTGGAWIMYFADAPTVTRQFWTGTAPVPVYFFTGLFTFTTYILAGWAREQVCTYMCPWPRFQSAMLDEYSLTVTYQNWRGEPRAHGKRGAEAPAAGATRVGDCVDCDACYFACPTGIDIRDGIQLECINCGLCIDACNHVMEKTGQQPWLITWDNLAGQAAKAAGRRASLRLLRPRTVIYASAVLMALAAIGFGLATRTTIALEVQHDRAPLYVLLPDGALRNGYTIDLTNRAERTVPFVLRLAGVPGAMLATEATPHQRSATLTLPAGPDGIEDMRVFVTARPGAVPNGSLPLDFILRDPDTGTETVYHSMFMGAADYHGSGDHHEDQHDDAHGAER
jgi:cytochrome c oxidase accessory protein FixG